MIPYGRHDITQEDVDAVVAVLKSDFLTQGEMAPKFERAVAERCGSKHAVATNSATSALHLACLALGLKAGDRMWTSAISFVASANCGRYCEATVDFVDIDPRTSNISLDALEQKLVAAENAGTLPKVLVAVHMCGQSCDMRAIRRLSERFGFAVIEDASHAIGGHFLNMPIGDCRYSDITVFSFHPVKIITTAEGGMALTNSPALAERMALLRSHGITRDAARMTHEPDGSWYYQQLDLGFNYRMNDLQAALGLSQLDRLDRYVSKRSDIARRYETLLADLPVTLPWQHPDCASAWHLYVIRLQLDRIDVTHREVFEALRAAGIGVNLHYIPIPAQPYYQALGFVAADYPEAERYYAEAITLPIYPNLTDGEQVEVANALEKALNWRAP